MVEKSLAIVLAYAFGLMLLLLVGALGALFIFNDQILRSNAPGLIKLVVTSLFPPKDIYALIVREGFDIGRAGNRSSFTWTPKYRGRYSLGVLLERLDADGLYGLTGYDSALRVRLTCRRMGNVSLNAISEQRLSPFISKYGTGFSFLTINVPENVPLDGELSCVVEVLAPDSNLGGKFGPVWIYVQKLSDK